MIIYVLYDKENKCFHKKGPKVAWATRAAAKNAAVQSYKWEDRWSKNTFEDQERFEIREIDLERLNGLE